MKRIVEILIKIIESLFYMLIYILHQMWVLSKKLLMWLTPRVKQTGTAALQKIKEGVDKLPGQIEQTKEIVGQKTAEMRANMPQYTSKINALSKQAKKAVNEASLKVEEKIHEASLNIKNRQNPISEKHSQPQPIPESSSNSIKSGAFTFKKKHLWAVIAVLVVIGGIINISRNKSGSYGESTSSYDTPSAPVYGNVGTNGSLYNSPGVMPPPTTTSNNSNASSGQSDNAAVEMARRMAQEDEEQNKAYREEEKIREAEQSAREAEDAARLKAMESQHRQEEQQMQRERMSRQMGNYGL